MMELNKICLIGLLMASFTAGQEEGTEGLVSGLMKMIKTEVSNQMKIERKTLKEEILREIRDDREKHEEIRKELERTREGKSIKICLVTRRYTKRYYLLVESLLYHAICKNSGSQLHRGGPFIVHRGKVEG